MKFEWEIKAKVNTYKPLINNVRITIDFVVAQCTVFECDEDVVLYDCAFTDYSIINTHLSICPSAFTYLSVLYSTNNKFQKWL